MSLDLLAAFDETLQQASTATFSQTSKSGGVDLGPHGDIQQHDGDDLDEEFGDFEDAAAIAQPAVVQAAEPPLPQHNVAANNASQRPPSVSNGESGKLTKKKPLPFDLKPSQPEADSRIGRHPFADHMDVLFTADEDEYTAGQDEWNDLSNNPEAAMAYSKQLIQAQLDAEAKVSTVTTQPKQKKVPPKLDESAQWKPRNLDVLFDANDLSDEAENDGDASGWGDFEEADASRTVPAKTTVSKPAWPPVTPTFAHFPPDTTASKTAASFDLLGLDDHAHLAAPQAPPTPETPQNQFQPRIPIARSPRSFNKIIERGFTDSAWDDFEDTIPVATVSAAAERKASLTAQNLALPKVPPANVPPPSVILSAFPDLLKQPVSQDNIRERATVANVLAHVIAGRKHRWKRSSTLAASMRIGPAAVGGKSGMKLTGLDRTETAKEDREVAEVLSVWRSQVGRFRSTYTTYIGSTTAEDRLIQARLPEVNDPAPVKTLKPQEGGLIAPHECALCGLKRQERIVNVDDGIDDSFGEWWVEGADMHTFCAAWWVKYETLLRSR